MNDLVAPPQTRYQEMRQKQEGVEGLDQLYSVCWSSVWDVL